MINGSYKVSKLVGFIPVGTVFILPQKSIDFEVGHKDPGLDLFYRFVTN